MDALELLSDSFPPTQADLNLSQLDSLSTLNDSDAAAILEQSQFTLEDFMSTTFAAMDPCPDTASVSSNSSCDRESSSTSSEMLSLLEECNFDGLLPDTPTLQAEHSSFGNLVASATYPLGPMVDEVATVDPVVLLADLIAAQASKVEMGTFSNATIDFTFPRLELLMFHVSQHLIMSFL
jgi:hypothetical protein